MVTTPKSSRAQKSLRERENATTQNRAWAISREVMQRLGRDQVLVDRLVEEMEASMASSSADNPRINGPGAALDAMNAVDRMDGLDKTDKTAEGTRRATMKMLLEQFLRQRDGANLPRTTSGSNLLGELKQCLDLESIVVRRCWEMMEEEWFDDLLRNTAA